MSDADLDLQRFNNSAFASLPTEGWDWQVKTPEWNLDLLIPARSIGMVYGPSNSGKSHLVCDMVMNAVRGDGSWQGIDQVSGPVVMFSESRPHIAARMLAYKALVGVEPKHKIHLFPSMGIESRDLDLLGEYIAGLPERPVLLVFDTFSTSFSLGDGGENDNTEVAKLIKRLEADVVPWMHPKGACMIVHHTSKASGGSTARGASALIGNIDWSINVQWDDKLGRTVAKWEKDRWRLRPDVPVWAGQAEHVEVQFSDGAFTMMALNWEEVDPKAQEAAEKMETEREYESAQWELITRAKKQIDIRGWAFIRVNRQAKVPAKYQEGVIKVAEFCPKNLQSKLIEWTKDMMAEFEKAPIYTKSEALVGYCLTAKSKVI